MAESALKHASLDGHRIPSTPASIGPPQLLRISSLYPHNTKIALKALFYLVGLKLKYNYIVQPLPALRTTFLKINHFPSYLDYIMTITNAVDLANVVLIFGSFVGVSNILELSENSRYEFTPPNSDADPLTNWKGGQPEGQEPQPRFLCLTFGMHLFSPDGWVVGSHADTDQCDLQLAENNKTGISRRYFRIDIDPKTCNPRVVVLSAKTLRIIDGDRTVVCRQGQPMQISRPVTVDLGVVGFRAWRPKLTNAEDRLYWQRASKYNQEVMASMPKYIPSIKSQPVTITSNVRYGRNDAVYINKLGIEGKGMSASVMMVEERDIGIDLWRQGAVL